MPRVQQSTELALWGYSGAGRANVKKLHGNSLSHQGVKRRVMVQPEWIPAEVVLTRP